VFDHSPGHTSPQATLLEPRHVYTLTEQWRQRSAFDHLKSRVDFFLDSNRPGADGRGAKPETA
jgi:hypothetical protein